MIHGTRAIVTCAAITNGCMAFLVFEVPGWVDPYALDRGEVPSHPFIVDDLVAHGWREDYGRWVCPAHPAQEEASSGQQSVP